MLWGGKKGGGRRRGGKNLEICSNKSLWNLITIHLPQTASKLIENWGRSSDFSEPEAKNTSKIIWGGCQLFFFFFLISGQQKRWYRLFFSTTNNKKKSKMDERILLKVFVKVFLLAPSSSSLSYIIIKIMDINNLTV